MGGGRKQRSKDQHLIDCQRDIGYQFEDETLLKSALTHSSGALAVGASNERLEFLGDSVLGLVCVEQLYRRFPEMHEGEMTKIKSAVVSRTSCLKFCQQIGLQQFVITGRGVRTESLTQNIMADAFEALIGAIYLDSGFLVAQEYVNRFVEAAIEECRRDESLGNYKSILQQFSQREFGTIPRYEVLDEQGPDHQRSFKVAVYIDGHCYPAAWGATKKFAEAQAAKNALDLLEQRVHPNTTDDR